MDQILVEPLLYFWYVRRTLMFPNSNFDDWKWATEQSCIHNEITSYKIPTLEDMKQPKDKFRTECLQNKTLEKPYSMRPHTKVWLIRKALTQLILIFYLRSCYYCWSTRLSLASNPLRMRINAEVALGVKIRSNKPSRPRIEQKENCASKITM